MSRFKLATGLVVVAGVVILAGIEFLVPHVRWRMLTDSGCSAAERGRNGDAERSFRAALEVARTFAPSDRRVAESALGLAEALDAQGRYAEAEPLAKEALALLEKRPDTDDLQLFQVLATWPATQRAKTICRGGGPARRGSDRREQASRG